MQFKRLVEAIEVRGAIIGDVDGAIPSLNLHPLYPKLYTRLLRECTFRAFDAREHRIYGNTQEEEDNLIELFSDEVLTEAIINAGFLPIGRPCSGHYDRICFDVRSGHRVIDAPVVRIGHEAILSYQRVARPELLSAGLLPLVCEDGEAEPVAHANAGS